MERIEVCKLSGEVNAPVLKLPERAFPGVLLQGDTLRTTYDYAAQVYQTLLQGGPSELAWSAFEVVERLFFCLVAYEKALTSHGLRLPYPGEVSSHPPVAPDGSPLDEDGKDGMS